MRTMTLQARVSKLERAANALGGVAVMFRHVDETDEAARERWQQDHPGENLDAYDLKVIILHWSDDELSDDEWPSGQQTREFA